MTGIGPASFTPVRKEALRFAAGAGDLGRGESAFTTRSGRVVKLAVWSEPDRLDLLDWAMASLKQSMAWGEVTYGRDCYRDMQHIAVTNNVFGAR